MEVSVLGQRYLPVTENSARSTWSKGAAACGIVEHTSLVETVTFLAQTLLSECPDEEAAKNTVPKLVGGHEVELRDRDRLMIRLPSTKE